MNMIDSADWHKKFPDLESFRSPLNLNDLTQKEEAIVNFKKQAEISSADDPLIFIVAGSMEIPWQCLNAVSPAFRKFITCISHSKLNEDDGGTGMTHSWKDMNNSFVGDGVRFVHISGRNGSLDPVSRNFLSNLPTNTCIPASAILWLLTMDRTGKGDVPDAEMTWHA